MALSELRINLLLAMGAMPVADPTVTLSIGQLTRHISVFGKFFRRLQQLDSAKFVELPTCTGTVLYYWSKVEQAANQHAQDLIQGTRKLLKDFIEFNPCFLDNRFTYRCLPSAISRPSDGPF